MQAGQNLNPQEEAIKGLLLAHIGQALNSSTWVEIAPEEVEWIWNHCKRIVAVSDYDPKVDFDTAAWKCSLHGKEYIIILHEWTREITIAENEADAEEYIKSILEEAEGEE